MIKIATAPVSYGVFGLARPDVTLPTGEALLTFVHDAGYNGVDLGAPGLFGTGGGLVDRLKDVALLSAEGLQRAVTDQITYRETIRGWFA